MKKAVSLILSLMLLLLSAAALAETADAAPAKTTAETLVDAAENLFFHTENVTLDGEAVFFLDSAEFKSAKAAVIRDMEDSFWQLKLHTPARGLPDNDGPIDSGYTITAHSEAVYVVEVRHPGVYKMAYVFPRTTILRQSAKLNLMAGFARNLAQQADVLLGEGAFTETDNGEGGKVVRVVLDSSVPDLVNTALTMAFQAVAERYFMIDYDQVGDQFAAPIADYYTITRGILYATRALRLKNADVTVELDAAGELLGVSGTLGVTLQTAADGDHVMDIDFRLGVTGRGTSKVERFDPEKEGLVPAGDYSVMQEIMGWPDSDGEPAPEEEMEPQGDPEAAEPEPEQAPEDPA